MKTERLVIDSNPLIIRILKAYLSQHTDQFTIIPQSNELANESTSYLVIQTTPDGTDYLKNILAGIGTVRKDQPIPDPRPGFDF